jgi:hypothetical protein
LEWINVSVQHWIDYDDENPHGRFLSGLAILLLMMMSYAVKFDCDSLTEMTFYFLVFFLMISTLMFNMIGPRKYNPNACRIYSDPIFLWQMENPGKSLNFEYLLKN